MNTEITSAKNVLVLGAYGLIGHGISMTLIAGGHSVTGLGRNLKAGQRVLPEIPWIERDMRDLCDEAAWREILRGFSTVVNCSGALQDGPEDDVEAIHHHAIAALSTACTAEDVSLIQISAVGATPDASTPFLASKGRGDAAIRSSGAKFHIFRPGLVLASNAYGGTTMLRMLAAVPVIQPIAAADAKIQTVSLDDVATAVMAATQGQIPEGFEGDLVEEDVHTLRDLVAQIRGWLGFQPAKAHFQIPGFGITVVSKVADALSHLGWRSPLRSTALKVLTEGVQGDPVDLTASGVPPVSSLNQTLRRYPVGVQDRLFARMALLAPVIIACLCWFWLTSGVIGILRVRAAASVLQDVGWPLALAVSSVLFWGVVDIMIGAAFAVRKYAATACWASIIVGLIYLFASSVTVPALWIDPLGPLVKVVPSIVLALVARVALEAR